MLIDEWQNIGSSKMVTMMPTLKPMVFMMVSANSITISTDRLPIRLRKRL